jgi:hypothetical protein
LAYNVTLAPGQSGTLTAEYYVADRKTVPHPRLMVEFPGLQSFDVPSGTVLNVDRALYVNGAFLVEFNTLAGHTYYVQYTDSAKAAGAWKTALPPVVGTGSRVQWVDDGPPKTDPVPANASGRFYRVLLVP